MAGNHPAMEGVDRNDALTPTPSFDWRQPICQFICNGAEDTLGSHYVHSFYANGSYAVANVSSDLPLGMFHISMMRIKHALAAARQEGQVEGFQRAVTAHTVGAIAPTEVPVSIKVNGVESETDDDWEMFANHCFDVLSELVLSLNEDPGPFSGYPGSMDRYDRAMDAAEGLIEDVELENDLVVAPTTPRLRLIKGD